jgi:UPF0716 protein FxsA
MDDMALGFAGLLLIFPGLITDAIALVVVVGPLRRRFARLLLGKGEVDYAPRQGRPGSETIEGDFRRVDDDKNL